MNNPDESSLDKRLVEKIEKYGPAANLLAKSITDPKQNPYVKASYVYLVIGMLGCAAVTYAGREIDLTAIRLLFLPCLGLSLISLLLSKSHGSTKSTLKSSNPEGREGAAK